jgi:hypothetical protein
MSRFDDIYGGRWLKAGDLDGRAQKFQIEAAEYQKVGKEQEEKLVLAFIGKNKGLILNATNAKALADKWGKSEETWPGKWLEAKPVETAFGPGVRTTPCEAPLAASEDVPF